MTNRIVSSISGINFRQLPNTVLNSFKNLDWKVKACFGAAVGFIVVVFIASRKAGYNPTSAVLKALPKASLTISNATPQNLGFSIETLNQKDQLFPAAGREQDWTFSEVCEQLLNAIRIDDNFKKNQVMTISTIDSAHILDFLNFGLPKGQTNADKETRKNSWIHIILTKLVEKKLITSFDPNIPPQIEGSALKPTIQIRK